MTLMTLTTKSNENSQHFAQQTAWKIVLFSLNDISKVLTELTTLLMVLVDADRHGDVT